MQDPHNHPRHIAIILDGNRRFAKRLLLDSSKGHELGVEKIKKLFLWCRDLGIREITLYAFSMQNFGRAKHEFEFLMNLFEKAFLDACSNEDIHKNKIRVQVIGRKHLLPERVQTAIRKAEEATKEYGDYAINFALAYGGREEITDAVMKIADDAMNNKISIADIDEKLISRNLYLDSEPDIIIRTGGDRRTSNFLPWQSVYSEWFFLDKFWPEFEKEDLIDIVKEFKAKERRYGK